MDKDLSLNNQLDSTKFPLQTKLVTFPADAGVQKNQVKVELAVRRPLSFSSMFMASAPLIRTTATAATVSSAGEFCVLSLQNNSKTGIQATGSARINMDCGMMTNSTAINAAAGQGSAGITATTLAAAGGIQQSTNWNVDSYQPYSPALDDPYERLTPDSNDFANCAESPPSLTVNNANSPFTLDLDGGSVCYSSLSIGTNRRATFSNGTVVISGGGVNVQGNLTLTSATIVLTNKNSGAQPIGSFDMNATARLNITAPTDGKWKGMAIYQDRRATDNSPTGNISNNGPNKINGSTLSTISGVIYFPNQQLDYNGNGNAAATCTQFVAKRIYWSGNSGTNNYTSGADCKLRGISAIKTGLRVRLVA